MRCTRFGSVLAVATVAAALLTVTSARAAIIISNDFDGNDGNDIGGLFGIVSNNNEQNDTSNASTGLLSFSGTNATVGFSSATGFDAQAFSSVTVTWDVASVTNGSAAANGWFFGLQSAQGLPDTGSTLWNNDPNSIGVNLFGSKGAGGGSVSEDNPDLSHIDVTSGANGPGDAALADGFTISLTLNNDNTYSVSSTGLANDFDQNLSGTFPGNFIYSDLGSTTYAAMTAQLSSATVMSMQINSVTVEGTTGGPGPAPTRIDDHFDNGDLATDVNGVNGGFVKLSNSAGGAGTASEAGTDATMVTTGNNDNTGIASIHSFDAAGAAATGFEMSFVVTSLSSDPANNGMFLGLTDDNTSFFRNIKNFGLVFSGNESRTSSGGGFGLVKDDNGSPGADVIFDDADLELSSLLDGFEATITADETGWAYEITAVNDTSGAPTVFSGADTWVNAGLPADFFSTYFDSTEYVAAWTQRGGGGNPQITTMIDRISAGPVGGVAIPEPSTFALAALGLLGLGFVGSRRQRK